MVMIINRQTPHRKTWKQKIDPAFDSMIKTYVGFLENFEQMPNEDISSDEELKNVVLNNPDWDGIYSEDRPQEVVIQFVKNSEAIDDNILTEYHLVLYHSSPLAMYRPLN